MALVCFKSAVATPAHKTKTQLQIPNLLQTNGKLLGNPPSEANETTPHWNVSVDSPDERQSEQSAWVPMLLGTCEAELEEVSVHKREQQLTRRQLL